jgi:hypothetical protein
VLTTVAVFPEPPLPAIRRAIGVSATLRRPQEPA